MDIVAYIALFCFYTLTLVVLIIPLTSRRTYILLIHLGVISVAHHATLHVLILNQHIQCTQYRSYLEVRAFILSYQCAEMNHIAFCFLQHHILFFEGCPYNHRHLMSEGASTDTLRILPRA